MDGARFVKRVGDRGIVTLPIEIREVLDVAEGDIVEMEILRVIKKATVEAKARGSPESVSHIGEVSQ
jgi:bifunctional DNA-binding transcriptional regulator/antitoxin component of YhaV-PrlF toxin-antitoxin module